MPRRFTLLQHIGFTNYSGSDSIGDSLSEPESVQVESEVRELDVVNSISHSETSVLDEILLVESAPPLSRSGRTSGSGEQQEVRNDRFLTLVTI